MSHVARRIAFVLPLAVAGALGACSLTTDLTGFSEPVRAEAGSNDAPVAAETPIVDEGTEASADSAPPPCVPMVTIDTPLASTLETWSPVSRLDIGYPKVEPIFGMPAAVLLPFVDTTPVPIDAGDPDAGPKFYNPPERKSAIGGIWQKTPVPLRSFDIDFEIFVKCTNGGSCADGVAFVWLATTSAAALDNNSASSGHVMGIPPGVGGGAVLADAFRNDATDTTDPPVPALEIVNVDATKNIGHYPWVVSSKFQDFTAAWHRLSISVRGDAVSLAYDASPAITGVVPSVTRGLVGFSAGTGGETDAVAVRNVKASFYDCVP
jgi:hypothetical protein